MATYKELHGTPIETVSSDPDNPVNGQVWYNSTSQAMKGFTSNSAGSWASGNNINTGRDTLAGSGIQTAAFIFGGSEPPNSALTESYDGTSWT